MFSRFIRGLFVIVVALTFVADLIFILEMRNYMSNSNTGEKWSKALHVSQVLDTSSGKREYYNYFSHFKRKLV